MGDARLEPNDGVLDSYASACLRGVAIVLVSIGSGVFYMYAVILGELITNNHRGTGHFFLGLALGVLLLPFMLIGMVGKPIVSASIFICLPTCCVTFLAGLGSSYGYATPLLLLLAISLCISLCIVSRFLVPSIPTGYKPPSCQNCGYDLRGLGASAKCPECGFAGHLNAGPLGVDCPCQACGSLSNDTNPYRSACAYCGARRTSVAASDHPADPAG